MTKHRQAWNEKNLRSEAKKYVTRGEFSKNSRSAYNAATRLGILDDICQHMKPARIDWTEKAIFEEAQRHNTMSSFWKKSAGAVRAAKKLGILEEATRHIEKKKKPTGFWTKTEILKEAKKYIRKMDFKAMAPGAWKATQRLNIESEVCVHMIEGKKPNGYWEKEENIFEEAKKYSTRMDFRMYSSAAAADRLGIYEKVVEHLPKVTNQKWTVETILEEATKYTTYKDFISKSGGAYNAAKRLGVQEELFKVIKRQKRKNGHWKEIRNLRKEASKYKTRKEFQTNSPSAYDSAFDLGLLDSVCEHMDVPEFTAYVRYLYVFEFDDRSAYVGISYKPDERRRAHETGKRKDREIDSLVHRKIKSGIPYKFIVFPEKLEPIDVAYVESKKISEYEGNGWKMLNRAKGGSLGGKPIRWTENKIRQEAKKYIYRRDFKEKAPGAYDRALDLGILQEVCAHMPKRSPYRVRKNK